MGISTPTFIVALFTVVWTPKQPKCPSTDEWIEKMQYIYVYGYIWMDLEIIILSEVSQKEKGKYHVISLTKQRQTHRYRKEIYGCQRRKGIGKGYIRNLGLADTNYYI